MLTHVNVCVIVCTCMYMHVYTCIHTHTASTQTNILKNGDGAMAQSPFRFNYIFIIPHKNTTEYPNSPSLYNLPNTPYIPPILFPSGHAERKSQNHLF